MGNPSLLIRATREIRGRLPLVAAGRAALQSGKVAHFREDFTTDFTDNTDGRVVSPRRPDASARRPHLESVKSVKSVVQFFLVAAGRAAPSVPFRG